MNEDHFHLGLKAIVRDAENRILLLQVNPASLKKYQGEAYWDIPGGRVKRGGMVEDTLRREIEEETGIVTVKSMAPFAMVLSNIRIPLETQDVGLVLSAHLCEVETPKEIKISEEHLKADWFKPEEAAELLKVKYPPEFTEKIKTLSAEAVAKTKRPKTGIGMMIFKDGKLLVGLRKSTYGRGMYSTPGGHLEYGESFEECGRREVREETGLEIKNVRFSFLMNFRTTSGKQYTHVGLAADWASGEPQNTEPDVHSEWQWYDLNTLPQPMFGPSLSALEAYKTGQNYFDGQLFEV